MQLTDDNRRRIEFALENCDRRSPLDILKSPLEYHYFVRHFNWDDGFSPIRDIVCSNDCDQGTGLLAYWLSGPATCMSPQSFGNTDYDRELLNCIRTLEDRLVTNDFPNRNYAVDPKNLIFEGDDWTQIEFYRPPPAALTIPTPGAPLPEDNLIYKLTPEDIARREQIDVQADLESLRAFAATDPAYEDNLRAYERWLAQKVPQTIPAPGTRLPEDNLIYKLTPEDIARREQIDVQADLESLRAFAATDPAYEDNLRAYERWLAEKVTQN